MNGSELQRLYQYPIHPRDSKIYCIYIVLYILIYIVLYIIQNKGFVNIDNCSMGGNHWTCFIVKDNKSYYFDNFGGQPDKFLLKYLRKPIIYHNYKTQDKNSKLCGSYCLNLFYLIERMNYYDAILKMYFG